MHRTSDRLANYKNVEQLYGSDIALKVAEIDNEIEMLCSNAKESGLTAGQIRKAAEPLLKFVEDDIRRRHRRKIGLMWLMGAFFIGSVAAILSYEPTYRLACACSRLLFIQVRFY